MKQQTNKKTFIDLFSGCGGLSLGFEMAGFEGLLAIDNWQDALDTYTHNRKNAKTLCGDISALDPNEVKERFGISEVDVIIGGPPCQGYSVAGKRIIEDERNELYKSFVRFVRCFKPKAFLMENVPNILSIGGGIIKDAIFVGMLNGNEFEFPAILTPDRVSSYDALNDLPEGSLEDGADYPVDEGCEYQSYARKGSKGVYNHQITIHNQRTQEIIAMVPDGGNYKDLPEELQQTRKVHIAWTRLNSKKPSFTIDCGHNHHFHYKYNRVPTTRESARIQSFPDKFVFTGNKGSQLRQVGNAVPPLLSKSIAEKLLTYL